MLQFFDVFVMQVDEKYPICAKDNHDITPAHRSLLVSEFLAKHKIRLHPQPSCSPDLNLADFYLFPKVKSLLKGWRFASAEEMKIHATRALREVAKNGLEGMFREVVWTLVQGSEASRSLWTWTPHESPARNSMWRFGFLTPSTTTTTNSSVGATRGARQTKRWYGEGMHAERAEGCITATRRGEVARAPATCRVMKEANCYVRSEGGGRTLPNRPEVRRSGNPDYSSGIFGELSRTYSLVIKEKTQVNVSQSVMQWEQNQGRCGVCGDPWHLNEPRPHEAGGQFAKGIISRHYTSGQIMFPCLRACRVNSLIWGRSLSVPECIVDNMSSRPLRSKMLVVEVFLCLALLDQWLPTRSLKRSAHLRLGLPGDLLPMRGSHSVTFCVHLPSLSRATWPPHFHLVLVACSAGSLIADIFCSTSFGTLSLNDKPRDRRGSGVDSEPLGRFEMFLCPNNNPKYEATQTCFERRPGFDPRPSRGGQVRRCSTVLRVLPIPSVITSTLSNVPSFHLSFAIVKSRPGLSLGDSTGFPCYNRAPVPEGLLGPRRGMGSGFVRAETGSIQSGSESDRGGTIRS
ncbi:hypothetical protein ANN_08152 [Periplaneta americana]|uniref:Tc1-like transposase DDE domain-containing protein n=1 Tax=Periplaneta americana TaxID=6978 RepID=A0ABQ8T0M8_PERAM|nr:hypothetical protein ANN_08152 [Periplaneta americana]